MVKGYCVSALPGIDEMALVPTVETLLADPDEPADSSKNAKYAYNGPDCNEEIQGVEKLPAAQKNQNHFYRPRAKRPKTSPLLSSIIVILES